MISDNYVPHLVSNTIKLYFQEARYLKIYLIAALLVIVTSYSVFSFCRRDIVSVVGSEDHLFEWLTALCFLASSVLLFLTYTKTRNFLVLLLAVLMFFGFGEEISWGQRLLGYHTPESIKAVNVQGEINIHNLEMFNTDYMSGGIKHGLARLLEINFLFKLFTIVGGILFPFFVFHFKPASGLSKKLKIPVPPFSIGIFFVLNWATYFLVRHLVFQPNLRAATEIFEFVSSFILLEIFFFFFIFRKSFIAGADIKENLVQVKSGMNGSL